MLQRQRAQWRLGIAAVVACTMGCGETTMPSNQDAGTVSAPTPDSGSVVDSGADGGSVPCGRDAAPCYDFSAVNSLLEDSLSNFGEGVYVAIRRDGKPLYEFSAGGYDERTVLKMASATKWIAGGVILSLADQGVFDLDDPVGDYLPVMNTYGKGAFTIRHAFSMSSGLFDASRYHTDRTLTLAASVDLIAEHVPFLFSPPGSAIAYDGKQMQIAGRVAEVATGKDWRTLAREQILDPCGMVDTNFDVFGLNPAVAGGISTTPADYLAYLRMIMDGGVCDGTRVLSEDAIEEMFTNQTNNAPVLETYWPTDHPYYPYGNDDLRYGFGAWVLAQDPETGVVEEITSPGAWGSYPWADRRRNIYGVVFTFVPLLEGGFRRVEDVDLELFQLVREAIDAVDR